MITVFLSILLSYFLQIPFISYLSKGFSQSASRFLDIWKVHTNLVRLLSSVLKGGVKNFWNQS